MNTFLLLILFFVTVAFTGGTAIPVWVVIGIFKGINEYIIEPREQRKRDEELKRMGMYEAYYGKKPED